jgi:hypothetical protein
MKYILAIILFILGNTVFAQNKPSYYINAKEKNGSIELSWYPTDVAIWKEGLLSGYTISRETVSGGKSNFIPAISMLKDSLWIKSNTAANEILSPIKSIVYNSNFLIKSNKENDAVQYNYLVFESQYNIIVAEALGMGIVDKNIAIGDTYRYTVKHNKSGQTTTITIKCDKDARVEEPKDYRHEFQFPNGTSLSDMLEMSKPIDIKAIIGKARPKLDSIILRWVPTNVEICRNAMADGYEIYRGKTKDDMVLITTVKPWTEAQLRQMPRQDTLALLAAAFVVDNAIPQGIDKANMFDQAAMEQNFFGFAMTAADRSLLAANVLGLRYVDKAVKFGETYLYEIRTKRLTPNFPVPDIWVTNEFEPLVAPEKFKIEKKDKAVTLTWYPNTDVKYSTYIIERLNPGDTVYHALTAQPMVFIRSRELISNQLSYVDSLPYNNQVYMYRIKGSNAFGEWSEYAYAQGYGRDLTPPQSVSLISGKFMKENNTIRISWTPNVKDKDLKYHQVLVSDNDESNFSAISAELSIRDTAYTLSLKDMDADRSFYFKINSVDSSGNVAVSSSRFVFVPDHERPKAPPTIKASISPKGLVTVSWKNSVSKDVVGYYVFFSNNDPQNLALVFDKPLNDTTYSWQIDMNSLTKYLYVGVKSEDDNYNRSFLSEILQVRRPDTIPPMRPLVTTVELKEDNIVINWNKSSSADVEKYLLFSRNPGDSITDWILIDSVGKDIENYTTTSELYAGQMMYSVKAVDDFDNQSGYSNSGQVFIPFPSHKFVPKLNLPAIRKNNSVDLSWQKQPLEIKGKNIPYKYLVYRSVGSQDVMMYKELPSDAFSVTDDNVKPGVLYNYAIRVKYDNGWTGALSEVKSILIK